MSPVNYFKIFSFVTEFTAASGGKEYDAGALIDRMPLWGEDLKAKVA